MTDATVIPAVSGASQEEGGTGLLVPYEADPGWALALVRQSLRANRRGRMYRRLSALLLALLWTAWCWNRRAALVVPLFPARRAAILPVPPPVSDAAVLLASRKRLTEADLSGRSEWELTLMRNAPYARHGYRFGQGQANAPIYAYFARQPWYRPTTGDLDACWERMSRTERANAQLLLRWQKRHGGQAVR